MFTGIVETLGKVTAAGSGRLVVRPSHPLKGLSIGESILVDGVCLTVDRLTGAGKLIPLQADAPAASPVYEKSPLAAAS